MPKLKISESNKEKYIVIKEDLKDQLMDQNKIGSQYDDLLDHAIYLFTLKDSLQEDILAKGLRIKSATGNGYKKEEDNKSVDKLLKVSAQLMKVLNELGLKEPQTEDGGNSDEDLL